MKASTLLKIIIKSDENISDFIPCTFAKCKMFKRLHSETCIYGPLEGPVEGGHLGQVVFIQRCFTVVELT